MMVTALKMKNAGKHVALLLALAASLAGVAAKNKDSSLQVEASAEIGKNKIELEVAATHEQIMHGLMERASMPENHGMVFLFRPSHEEQFWMAHCLMSLDMMFVKDGKILTISRNVPPFKGKDLSEAPRYPENGPVEVSEVIEVNGGYCNRHGIKEGDSVTLHLDEKRNAK